MNIGFIKLHRILLDSKVFANEKSLKIWIWLLLKVTFEKRFVPISVGRGTTPVELLPGELIFGRFQAEESLCIDGSTIYKKLKEFENDGMITIKSNSHYSIITICNWETYQGLKDNEVTAKEQQSNNEVATKEQQSNTNKKENNVKKEKKVKEFIAPTLIECENYFKENGYTMLAAEKFFKYYDISNWIDSKGTKVRNWKQKAQAVWFKPENLQLQSTKEDIEEKHRLLGKTATYEDMERKPQ